MKGLQKYRQQFTEFKLWEKLRKVGAAAGAKVVYTALLLYYAYRRPETPAWAKRLAMGGLGYLIVPIDAIPDLSFLVGYTDDLGVLSFALVTIAAYVNDEVKSNARERMQTWFGPVDEEALAEVDDKL